jgi:hypothetical protein
MKILPLTLFAILLSCILSCNITNNVHLPRQDVHYFSGKGELNSIAGIELNNYSTGFNLNGNYSVTNNFYINGGVNYYFNSNLWAKNISEGLRVTTSEGFDLKGTSFQLGLGMYSNMNNYNYFEAGFQCSKGNNILKTTESSTTPNKYVWRYKPVMLTAKVSIGKNKKRCGISFLTNIDFIHFGEKIPYQYGNLINVNYGPDREIYDNYILNSLFITPALYIRVGGGHFKWISSVGIAFNCSDLSKICYQEPIFKICTGILYDFK